MQGIQKGEFEIRLSSPLAGKISYVSAVIRKSIYGRSGLLSEILKHVCFGCVLVTPSVNVYASKNSFGSHVSRV